MNWILSLAILSFVLIVLFYILSAKRKNFQKLRKTLLDLFILFFVSLTIYILNTKFVADIIRISEDLNKILWPIFLFFTLTFALKLLSFIIFDFIYYRYKEKKSSKLIKDVFVIIFFCIGLLFILKYHLGVPIDLFLASSAVLTVVAGFALQDTLGDLFSGIVLNFEESLKFGDWIKIGDIEGRILEIRWRSMKLHTLNDTLILIPNRIAAREKTENFGQHPQSFALRLQIGVHYKDSPGNVIRVITEVLNSVDGVLREPEPIIMVDDFQDFSVNYELKFWLKEYSRYEIISSEIRRKIWYGFKRNGIVIPFPIRNVYIRKELKQDDYKPLLFTMLKSSTIFNTFTDEQLIDLIDDTYIQLFTRGDILIREGEEGRKFYFILEGSADVLKGNKVITQLKEGDYFGEMSLFSGETTSATIRIAEDSRLFSISSERFKEVIKLNDKVAKKLSEVIARRKVEILQFQKDQKPTKIDIKKDSENILKRIKKYFNI